MIIEVVAALIRDNNKFLICQRPANKARPLLWEFAGGKAYPDITVHLTLYNAAIAEGIPQLLEHNDIRWIPVEDISNYEFCPADEEILARLRKIK